MEFLTPFINMFENDMEYIKIMNNLEWYMKQEVKFAYWADGVHGGKYPVGRLGDVLLHFNHAETFEEAYEAWNRRVGRINYDKVFAMMFTEDPEVARKFAELPYNKVCFTTFRDDSIPCVHYCESVDKTSMKVYEAVNSIAQGIIKDYDVFDLLLGENNYKRISKKESVE